MSLSSHGGPSNDMYFQQPQNPPTAAAGPSTSASQGQGNGNQRLAPPPSRLSPPPGTSMEDLLASTDVAGKGKKKKEDAPKRGYRACVHCRLRKARCDLGDVNSPSEPPCTRCRREQRNCVFLPSKRRRKTAGDDDGDDRHSLDREESADWKPPPPPAPPGTLPQQHAHFSNPFQGSSTSGQDHSVPNWPGNFDTKPFDTSLFSLPQTHQQAANQISQQPPDNATPASLPSVQSVQSHAESSNSGHSPNTRKRRREGDGARRIVVANFSNETDALEILANAATDDKKDQFGQSAEHDKGSGKRVVFEDKVGARLDEFVLVKQRIIDVARLELLVRVFFEHHHPALPVFQTARIPRTNAQLASLCRNEPFLISVLIAVASAHHPDPGMKECHERTWATIRDAIEDYTFSGSAATVGFVEGVLLLAENLPREVSRRTSDLLSGGEDAVGLHGTENRRSWALTGLAIRAAYGLGLDQIAIEINEAERTADVERARSTWTWCYLYDRTIGLRTGLAFWSRGPSLCFVGYSHISQTGERAAVANFPYMLNHGPASPNANEDTDSASLMQALVELTQIMTNAHDILYPSKTRTDILVRQGEYFKFLDSFHRALQSFKSVWLLKKWNSSSLEQLCWCTYHFVRLYVSSFAFQAHVQRAQARAEGEMGSEGKGEGREKNVQLFPRGSATSPDALYIYESIDAATEILQICLRLGQMGVLRYLPSRYLMNFVYGGVFALKAGYSGATSQKDMAKTREMVDHVCAVLVLACPDRDHAASRYGQMLRMLSKKLEQLDASAVPSRFPSPEPQPLSDLPVDLSWNFAPTPQATTQNPFQMTPISSGLDMMQSHSQHLNQNQNSNLQQSQQQQQQQQAQQQTNTFDPFAGLANNAAVSADDLFNFDVDVRFDLDGFWEDFTLGEGSGFPFR